MYDPMYDKVYQAAHPDMMDGAANQQLRDRYLSRRCSFRARSALTIPTMSA